ncbi:carbohydrate ABC transporter permease [Arthrobacter castelli]|uniref:carbohydrate ABC transporter permease n=1 Tax=Arthrobacter castelli TaxID=271431 RepID=UPI00040356E0|nr:sugar ABC transporter permease [Arthrobacter castelli]
MAIIAVLFLFPAVYNLVLSFQQLTPYQSPAEAVWVGLRNFVSVFTSPQTATAAINTALPFTFATVAARVVLGLGLAQLLQSRTLARWRLRGLARTLALLPWMIPPVAAVASWRWMLNANTGVINQILTSTGLVDSGIPFLAQTSTVWWAIDTILVWRELPFVVIVIMAGLQAIPQEQYEAAELDSANRWQRFRYVTLPNLRPVLLVVVLITTIQTFNNFVYVWLTTGGGPGNYTQVLATQLYSAAFIDNNLGQGAAIGLIMSIVMLIFALVYLRITSGKENL